MTRRSRGPSAGGRQFPRTARLNRLFREILAEELELIDDDRLELVTVIDVEVDAELSHATLYYVVHEPDQTPEAAAALAEHRVRLQRAIGSQARIRRVPELRFAADRVTESAARIEAILRDLPETRAGDPDEPGGPDEADQPHQPDEDGV